MPTDATRRYDAFVSYNSRDHAVVQELAERLRGKGLELYLEEWELAPGREFQPALAEGLRDSKACVVFLGPNGLGWQQQEIQVAIDKRARDSAFAVIPVLLPGSERPRCERSPRLGVREPFTAAIARRGWVPPDSVGAK